jgi:hypothetical protein
MSVLGNWGAPHAVAEIGQLIGRPPALNTAFTTRDVEDGSFAPRLQAFAKVVAAFKGNNPIPRPVMLPTKAA